MQANMDQKNFRVFGPDETASNRLQDVITGTGKSVDGRDAAGGRGPVETGRVMEVLSEHMCQGWLEGYLLTGRHGFFSCYEAFIHIIDSMVNQHAKWLKTTREIPWRKPIASLNYLLSSLVWRQDHNGFSHQDPGFIDHLLNKKADVVRIYLPPDANTLLSVADHCLRSRNYINLIVAGKQPAPQWLTIGRGCGALHHGLGVWPWASNDEGDPEVVMACCGDVPTLEALAAVCLLREQGSRSAHPRGERGGPDDAAAAVGASAWAAGRGVRPDLSAPRAHGVCVPWLSVGIHRLTYRRHNHDNMHVRGYKEEGHHDHSLRHVRAEQYRPFPVHAGRDQARAAAWRRNRRGGAMVLGSRFSGTSCMWPRTATICRRSRTGAGRRSPRPNC
jgi:xylulose-5-phosphate/fructose-6-phosphate phosphoketolase